MGGELQNNNKTLMEGKKTASARCGIYSVESTASNIVNRDKKIIEKET